MSEEKKTCQATVYTGAWSRPRRCSRTAVSGADFCHSHDPKRKEERLAKVERENAKREAANAEVVKRATTALNRLGLAGRVFHRYEGGYSVATMTVCIALEDIEALAERAK